ncbi:hypothetical protein NDU88_002587 [Pleurodeles waltl]|uniref:Uncharacterized protein n=1 Tax=Pleurodeles waltl TaxID=8319 RepID=A0AAV7SEN8_PLEWA|nr:hypothetical protein NDU88_002587 [Pleurodeles waltl]
MLAGPRQDTIPAAPVWKPTPYHPKQTQAKRKETNDKVSRGMRARARDIRIGNQAAEDQFPDCLTTESPERDREREPPPAVGPSRSRQLALVSPEPKMRWKGGMFPDAFCSRSW